MSMIDGVSDADIQKFTIDDSIVSDNQVIGSFCLNSATIKLINLNKKYSSLKGKWVNTVMGELFVFEAPETQGDITIELKCYDLAYKFDSEYSLLAQFPMTVGGWLKAICDAVGVPLATPTFPNSEVELASQPYLSDGASFRDAVREIAGAAGSFAQIIDGKLYIKWFDNATTEVEDWFNLTQEEQTEPVNVVVLGRGDLENNIMYPSVAPENPHELRIDDNQILLDREQDTIVPIYDQVVGFCYKIFSLRYIGLKNLKAGQRIRYHDIDGELVETYIMSNSLSFCGGDYNDPRAWESTVSSSQLNETSTNYQYAGSIMKSVKNTEAKVDKVEGNIQLITEDVQSVRDEFGNYYTREESNTLVQTASEGLMNTFSKSGGNNLIKNSSLYFGSENKYDYWEGNLAQTSTDLSASKKALLLKKGIVTQEIGGLVPSYLSLRLCYKKIGSAISTSAKLIFGDMNYEFTDDEGVIETSINIGSGAVNVIFEASDDNQFIVYDLMLNYGENIYLPYQQAQNELKSTQVSISEEIKVESNTENTVTTLGASGLEGRNKTTNEIVFKQTDTGLYSKSIETESAKISDLVIQKIGDQVWITGV